MAQKTGRKWQRKGRPRGWSGPMKPLGPSGGGVSGPGINTDWEKRREERRAAMEQRKADRDARLADLDSKRQGAGLPAMGNPLATGMFGPDADHYATYFAPPTQGETFVNYHNEEINALFEQARRTLDEEVRNQIYAEIDEKLWDELPLLPLHYEEMIYVLNNRVNIEEAVLDANLITPFQYPEKIYFQE